MTEASAQKSTTVRFDPPAGTRFIRPVFGTLGRIAPRTTVRLATRIWCTPPRPRLSRLGTRPGNGHRSEVSVNGHLVTAEVWEPAGADAATCTVYLVHGWGGWRGQLDAFVDPLVTTGHRVVSFDALGHGESARGPLGRLSTLPEMSETLAAVVQVHGPAYAVVAHSLGGTAAALAVLDGLAVHRIVLIAALADPPSYTHEFARALGFGERVRTGLLNEIERMVARPAADFDLPPRLRTAVGLPPALLVHDRDDKQSRYSDAPRLARSWPDSELLTTHGLGHQRILRDRDVVDRAVGHLRTVQSSG